MARTASFTTKALWLRTKCFDYANRSSLRCGAKASFHFGHEPSVWLEQPRSPQKHFGFAQSVLTALIAPRYAAGRKLRFTSATSHLYGSNSLVHHSNDYGSRVKVLILPACRKTVRHFNPHNEVLMHNPDLIISFLQ
jgi:hypothetical protein